MEVISFHGTHKLITKILQRTETYIIFFAKLTKKVGIISIHSHWITIGVLAAVIFLSDKLKGKGVSAPDSIIRCSLLTILIAYRLKIAGRGDLIKDYI